MKIILLNYFTDTYLNINMQAEGLSLTQAENALEFDVISSTETSDELEVDYTNKKFKKFISKLPAGSYYIYSVF